VTYTRKVVTTGEYTVTAQSPERAKAWVKANAHRIEWSRPDVDIKIEVREAE
jgi:hypothetical protein